VRSSTDPTLRSFIEVDPESPFSIQNLPYGVFRPAPDAAPRVGVAIGECVLDLSVLEERGFFGQPELQGRRVFAQPALNALMALGPAAWRAAREQISRLLRHDVATLRDDVALRDQALVLAGEVELCLPCAIGAFTDFYASRDHALNVSRIFRGPDATLPAAYLHLPIGYNGRASSVVVSGTEIRRPRGVVRADAEAPPTYAPSGELDFELEVGCLIGRGNAWGEPIAMARVPNQIFGLVLLNDWSARDIQAFEYQPLGPFLGKAFATTISPWVVTMEALAPFRCDGPAQDLPPLPHLQAKGPQAYDLHLEAALHVADGESPQTICRTNFKSMYWSLAQMVVHHASGGCNLQPGDLLGSGTVSGTTPDSRGCLLERTQRGAEPLTLDGGAERVFLADGDTVILDGWCQGDGHRVGFGPCRGTILPPAAH
jgi:fumarylacetoacetase